MKVVLVAFNGEFMCFIHVLLNALDMAARGHSVEIVLEGSATGLVPELAKEGNPLSSLYQQAKQSNLIAGVCKACSSKMGTLEAVREEGLALLDDMNGHPGLARYLEEGYQVITF